MVRSVHTTVMDDQIWNSAFWPAAHRSDSKKLNVTGAFSVVLAVDVPPKWHDLRQPEKNLGRDGTLAHLQVPQGHMSLVRLG